MMNKILTILMLVLLTGCSTFNIPNYTTQKNNQEIIQKATARIGVKTKSPTFKDDGSIFCRGAGPVKVAQGQTFTQYISSAISQELRKANALDLNSAEHILVEVTHVDFSTNFGRTNWYINANYYLNGNVYSISTVYNDKSSFNAGQACSNMAYYFPKAVSTHINELFSLDSFKNLIAIKNDVTTNLVRDPLVENTTDIHSKLKQLKKLHTDGLITDIEYDTKRKEIIDSM